MLFRLPYSRLAHEDIESIAPKGDLIASLQVQQPAAKVDRTAMVQTLETAYRFTLGSIAGGK